MTQATLRSDSLHRQDCSAIRRFVATLPGAALEFARDESGAVLAMFRFAGTELCVWREAGEIIIQDLAASARGFRPAAGFRTAQRALANLLTPSLLPAGALCH